MSLNVNNNVGYTVVDGGSISVVNGIASGFGTNDYLETSQTLSFSTQQKIEIATKITTGDTVSTSGIIGPRYGNSTFGIYLQGNKPSTMFYYNNGQAGKNSYNTSSVSLNTNTTYYLKAIYDIQNVTSTIMVSTDGINYTSNTKTLNDFASWYTWIDNNAYRIGNTQSGTFAGSIDLNETYIKVNGITWFNGKQQASPTVNEVYLNRNVGYDIVGNPTIVDGVVSGFSLNDYFKVNGLNWSSSIKLEFVCRFKVDTSLITFTNNYTNICYWPFATYFYIGSSTSPTTIVPSSDFTGVSGEISYGKIPTNQYYWIKLETDGNGNATTYSSEDGTTWTQKGTKDISSTTTGVYFPAFGMRNNTGGFPGSIDLNETYIKVNGITWFNGKQQASPTVNEVYLNRNVGYDIVGNPTIVDGVASGFSGSDYLQLQNASTVFSNSSTFEIITKFKLSETSSWQIINKMWTTPLLYQGGLSTQNGKVKWYIYNDSVSTSMTCATTLSKDVWYYAKQTKINNVYSVSWSNDGVTWYDTKEVELADAGFYNTFLYGSNQGYGNKKLSIDLNETYIKVNGVTWFNGKYTNFSNQNNYIINNGNIVWANPNLWLESSGTQYIDTGYTPIQYDEIKTDIMFTSSDFSIFRPIFSAGTENYQFIFGPFDSKTYFKYFAQGDASQINFLPNINTWYSLNIDENGVCSFGEYTTTSTYTSALDGDNTTMYLFMRRNNSSSFIGKLKSFIIKNKGIIKKHFVPVPKGLVIGNYTVPSNGMWDIVSQTFFANQGTGSFNFGKDATPIWTRSV